MAVYDYWCLPMIVGNCMQLLMTAHDCVSSIVLMIAEDRV